MWEHPVTERLLAVLECEWGVRDEEKERGRGDGEGMEGEEGGGWVEVLRPMEKELACGDVGIGAMCDFRDIVGVIERILSLVLPPQLPPEAEQREEG
jgi:phosphopantothenoylcysteine decarboxylase